MKKIEVLCEQLSWKAIINDNRLKQFNTPLSLSINCVAVHNSLIFAATVLGAIYIYKAENAELLCEISAHARPINVLDVAQDAALVSVFSWWDEDIL